jgi:hypothetical protein
MGVAPRSIPSLGPNVSSNPVLRGRAIGSSADAPEALHRPTRASSGGAEAALAGERSGPVAQVVRAYA